MVSSVLCPGCKGWGGRDCPVCTRRLSGPAIYNRVVVLRVLCRACGGTRKGRTRYHACGSCRGTGADARSVSVPVRIMGSGTRRCGRCNKDGHIPFSGSGRPVRRVPRLPAGRRAEQLSLGRERTRRFTEFHDLVKLAVGGGPDIRWRAGAKVPFKLLREAGDHASGGLSDEQTFACGGWCTLSMKKLLVQRAKNLGHDPRPVDVSDFRDWMTREELAYLRSHSLPCGSGRKAARDVRAFVRLAESARRLGSPGGIESSRLVRTTFAPAAPVSAVRAKPDVPAAPSPTQAARPFVAPGFRLVVLRDPKSWPDLEVVLEPSAAAGSGLDMGPVKRAFASLPGSLTLFYRVKMVERRAERRGTGARSRVKLIAQIRAAVLGRPDDPGRVWICGVSAPRR